MAPNLHTSDFRIALLFFCAVILGGLEHLAEAVVTTSPAPPPQLLRFTLEPSDVVTQRSEAVLFNCSAESPYGLPINISWWKDGKAVNDARRSVQPDGALFIRRVKHKLARGLSDEGLYACHARTSQGTIVSRSALLQIASMDRYFSEEPASMRAPEGHLARFRCSIQGTPSPSITWEKERAPLLPQDALVSQDGRIVALPSGVLQIQNVRPSDAGSYRCHARNLARDRHSLEANLTIIPNLSGSTSYSPPQIMAAPQESSVLLGSSVVLECAINGLLPPPSSPLPPQQQPQQVEWSRIDDLPLPPGRHQLIGRSNLQLHNVQPEDQGAYKCALLTTSDGSSYTTSIAERANLVVLVPPESNKSAEHITKPTAHTVRLTCVFEGVPEVSVSWMYNGVPLNSSGRIMPRGSTLLIWQSVAADSGYYQCIGRNAVGQTTLNQLLTIQSSENAPSPPSTLHISSISSRQVVVSWAESPQVRGEPTLAYSIHYFPTGGGEELQRVVEKCSANIDRLLPFTNYTFYLVAYNKLGASPHSPKVYMVTGQDVPLAAPSCRLVASRARSLRVEWDVLPAEQARGQIAAYQIHYRKSGSSTLHIEEASGNLHQYTLTGLEPNQKYDVRVLAGTSLGFPSLDDAEWPWVSQVTDPNLKSGVPEAPLMQLQALNATSLLVLWERPEVLGAELIGYKLAFRKDGDSAASTIILTGERTRHTLIKLEAAQWYEVSLQGFNQLGDGDQAVTRAQTMDSNSPHQALNELPPPPPLMATIEAEALNESAIRVRWHKPLFDLTPITHYTVLMHLVEANGPNSEPANPLQITTSETSVVVGGLQAFSWYEFKVRGHTAFSQGEYSGEIQCRTDEGKPSSPLQLESSLQSPSVVQLQWQPPKHKNGIIISYVILYCKETISSWNSKLENGSSTTAVVADLDTDALYYFKLRAVTGRGAGPDSSVLEVYTEAPVTPGPRSKVSTTPRVQDEKRMGIIVGVCIGLGCIVICIAIILLRNHCCPPLQPPSPVLAVAAAIAPPTENSAGTPPLHPQGNGEILWSCQVMAPRHSSLHDQSAMTDFHELDSFIPMLPADSLSENKRSDTKGGSNGRVNSLVKINGIRSNGRVKAAYLLVASDLDDAQVPLQETLQQQQQNMSSTCSDYSSAEGHVCSLEEIDRSLNSDDLIVSEDGSSSGTETDPVASSWAPEEEVPVDGLLSSSQPLLLCESRPQAATAAAADAPSDTDLHVPV